MSDPETFLTEVYVLIDDYQRTQPGGSTRPAALAGTNLNRSGSVPSSATTGSIRRDRAFLIGMQLQERIGATLVNWQM